MQSTKPHIVVVTYNGEKDIARFLESLRTTVQTGSIELIVVDNNSSDDTYTVVEKLAPAPHVIRNTENRGYAGAGNQGIQYAMQKGAEYVFLANQDIIFEEGWLAPLLSEMNAHPDTAAAQPLIMLDPERTLINSCGNALHVLGFGFTRGYRKTVFEYPCYERKEVAYCSGAAVLLRVSALARIGLMDEEFFMYHEDTDLGWRLRSAGYHNIVAPSARVYHRYDFARSIQKFYFMERNRYLILAKNYEFKTLLLLLPLFVVWEVGLLFYGMIGAVLHPAKTITVREKMRAFGYFFSFRRLSVLLAKRARAQDTRILRDKALAPLFTSQIQFQDIDNPVLRMVANPITKGYIALIRRFI
jgi:GT2 family glycosyltransferase